MIKDQSIRTECNKLRKHFDIRNSCYCDTYSEFIGGSYKSFTSHKVVSNFLLNTVFLLNYQIAAVINFIVMFHLPDIICSLPDTCLYYFKLVY